MAKTKIEWVAAGDFTYGKIGAKSVFRIERFGGTSRSMMRLKFLAGNTEVLTVWNNVAEAQKEAEHAVRCKFDLRRMMKISNSRSRKQFSAATRVRNSTATLDAISKKIRRSKNTDKKDLFLRAWKE